LAYRHEDWNGESSGELYGTPGDQGRVAKVSPRWRTQYRLKTENLKDGTDARNPITINVT
jgi:hypothetical protein